MDKKERHFDTQQSGDSDSSDPENITVIETAEAVDYGSTRDGEAAADSSNKKSVTEVAKAMDCDSQKTGETKKPGGSGSTKSEGEKTSEQLSKEMEKIGLVTKRLSGAQRKKRLKERKMAEGTWTKENPAKIRGKETGKPTGGQKRNRSESQTPPQATTAKKSRSGPPPTGTFSEVAKGIRVAIIQRRHPDESMNKEQADLVQNTIVEAIFSTPSGSTSSPPQFLRTNLSAGILWMTCANQTTVDWLRRTVGTLGRLWEGADLTVVDPAELPKRPRVLVFVPEPETVQEEEVRRRLQLQNPELQTDAWRNMSRKIEKDGQLLFFSISEASMAALKRSRFKAFYKLDRVTFKVLADKPPEHEGNSSKPPTQ